MTTTPAAQEPFKGPFAVLSVSSVDRAVLSYRVIDAERLTIADRLSQKEAQWLCDRLNQPSTPAQELEPSDERAFQAFWAWTNHPSEEFARKAWQQMLDGAPEITTKGQETAARAPDAFSIASWRRVADRLTGLPSAPKGE